MTKYLELDNLVREKNEVLMRLSHLPINVRNSIPNSILLSERQFNMLNNYELVKKVIVANGMITKLEVDPEDQSIFIGGVGTFISKYSAETRQIMLTSEKSMFPVDLVYFCNGLLVDKKKQIWVLDGKKSSLILLDHNLVEKKTFQGLSFDRKLVFMQEGGFITTEVICLNSQKNNLYWFRGKGMISRIDCLTLDKEDYDITVTSNIS